MDAYSIGFHGMMLKIGGKLSGNSPVYLYALIDSP